MFDATSGSNAPRVRVQMLARALERHARVTLVMGSRFRRAAAAARLIAGGLGRFDAVYVETPTTAAMPWDLAVLAAARARRRPVGIYFRDAYQLFRDLHPLPGWRPRLADAAWRVSIAVMRRLASVVFTPTRGLAEALRMPDAVPLPPGTDPDSPDLGPGTDATVAYVGALAPVVGFDRLVAAVERVRAEVPAVRLLAIGPGAPGPLPEFVDVRHANRDRLPDLLGPARVCAIPLPITSYTDIAWPFKLSDYLALGKPIVATRSAATAAVLDGTDAALLVGDSPAELAAGITRILDDDRLAGDLARNARALAERPDMTWDHRARTLLACLGVAS
jgi:glycosyltransferase involved in cell wall biosynthesis